MTRLEKLIAKLEAGAFGPFPPRGITQWNQAFKAWSDSGCKLPFDKSRYFTDYSFTLKLNREIEEKARVEVLLS